MAQVHGTASGSGSRGTLRRTLARTARRLRHGRPDLSVVVLAGGNDPAALRRTLSAVRDQPTPALEILVVGVGTALAEVRDEAALQAQEDSRARFVLAPSISAARRIALERTSGQHVLVSSPGDDYLPGTLAGLVEDLRPGVAVLLSGANDPSTPVEVDLATAPSVAAAPYLGALVVPRERLVEACEGDRSEDLDGFAVALGVLRSGALVLGRPCHRDSRAARPTSPFTARRDPFPDLGGRVSRDAATLRLLADLPDARAVRARAALAGLAVFGRRAELASDHDWALLVQHAGALRDDLDPDHLGDDVVANVAGLLAAGGHREDLVALLAAAPDDFPTVRRDGRVLAVLPVRPGLLTEDDLEVSVEQTPVVARALRLDVDGSDLVLDLDVGVRHLDQAESDTVLVELLGESGNVALRVTPAPDPAVGRWLGETEHDHDAGRVRTTLGTRDLATGMHALRVTWSDGEFERVGLLTEIAGFGSAARNPVELPDGRWVGLHRRHGRVALGITASGTVGSSVVTRAEVDGEVLRLTVDRSIDQVSLRGSGSCLDAVRGAPGFWSVPLRQKPWGIDSWGRAEAPLPPGSYRLELRAGGAEVPAVAAPGLLGTLPAEIRTPSYRVQLRRADGDCLQLRLDPPLADDELGPRPQQVLRAELARRTDPLDQQLVYFQSFTGQFANDNPLAIQAELARLRPDLDICWAVADASSPTPPGARPVLVRSREWYEVLGRAGHLVTNVELEPWFRRREGQQILQTFHGYPSKAMGLSIWEARGFAPDEIRSYLARTSGVWNVLVTPTAEMDQYYRRDYRYDGTILPLGYPRNDALVGASLDDLRERTRRLLGIGPHQRAILYAPTWRDDLATGFRAAHAVHHLDVAAAASALGEEYVLLLRGHRFHAPVGGASSQVLDVTRYPDVNHLIAAADAAVLDYSSLRFDFALTGKPMVFLVPDLDSYGTRVRGFLWDFGETAPGPWVASTAAAVEQLSDLAALTARTAPEIAAFNARYNPMHDGRAAERVVAAFFADLLDGSA